MFSSFAVVLTICFVVGAIIVAAVISRSKADDSIGRVLYNAEHPEKTR